MIEGLPEDALIMGHVEIVRYLSREASGDVVMTKAVDREGVQLPLIESLGMLRLAEGLIVEMHLESDADEMRGQDDDLPDDDDGLE